MGNSENQSYGPEPFPDKSNPFPRVLVVDDDIHIRELIARHLSEADYRVDTASDGAEAWKALNDVSYHLLITDYQMPNVTGLELIKKLRSEDMALPVILVSGTLPMAELKRHPELRIEATFEKPFSARDLLDTVEKFLKPGSQSPFADFPEKLEVALQTAGILPVHERAVAPSRQQINSAHRILVVDDDPDLRQLNIDVLTAAHYAVDGAKDGAEGWDALQANHNHYDLIITDNHMPKMTGIELIEKLRSAHLTHPVIMATGELPRQEFARRPWLKPDVMLQRPYTNDALLEAVKNVLSTNNGNGE